MKKEIWTVFLVENYNGDNRGWTKEHSFYMGDCSDWNLETDWRTKEVDGSRKQLILLGIAEVTFPVKYPIITIDGKEIKKQK